VLESITFHSTNKAASLLFSIVKGKKKSSFYSTIFIIWRKASGKQFLRIRNLYEALVSLRTSRTSIKPRSNNGIECLSTFSLLNKEILTNSLLQERTVPFPLSPCIIPPATTLVPKLKISHHRSPSLSQFSIGTLSSDLFRNNGSFRLRKFNLNFKGALHNPFGPTSALSMCYSLSKKRVP